MFKKKLLALLLATAFVFAFTGIGQAAVATKQVKVNYSNIKLIVDGNVITVSAAQEPFILGGTTYVPLRVAAEALNSNVNWQAQTKTVDITSRASVEVNTLKLQLEQKNKEIESLKAQIASLQTQLNNCKDDLDDKDDDDDDWDDEINDLEDDLNDDYDELEDVEIEDITVDGDEDDVDVEVEVDLGDFEDEWADLSDSDIENWIEDMVDDIQNALDEDTEVNGEIYDNDSDDTLVEFYKDGEDDLEIDFYDEDYR